MGKCVICGKEFEGSGHAAFPVSYGSCCDDCNGKVVIPQREKNLDITGSYDNFYGVVLYGGMKLGYIYYYGKYKDDTVVSVCFRDDRVDIPASEFVKKCKPVDTEAREFFAKLGEPYFEKH